MQNGFNQFVHFTHVFNGLMLTVREEKNLQAGVVSHFPQQIHTIKHGLTVITRCNHAGLVVVLREVEPLSRESLQLVIFLFTANVLKEVFERTPSHIPIHFVGEIEDTC